MHSLLFGVLSLGLPLTLAQTNSSNPSNSPSSSNSSNYPNGHPFPIDIQRPQIPRENFTTLAYTDPRTGVRENITYITSDTGNVIYHDDINWGSESLLLQWARQQRNETVPSRKRGVGVKSAYAWPDATVTYRYDSCKTRALLQGIVDSAIKEWKKGDPFLIFKELAPSPYSGAAGGILTITSHDADSYWCYSNVALDNGGTGMRMNLQWLSKDGGESCGQRLRTVLHEFGHALGLLHEQSRPDRGNHINLDCTQYSPWTIQGCDNGPYAECCNAGETNPCCGDWHNFDAANTMLYDMYGSYNCKSIMHYRASDVLRSTAGCQIDPSPTPTQGDFDAVCDIYKDFCKPWKDQNNCASQSTCGTCNPTSGLNGCDISASCISTGTKFHCACRAGFKAAAEDSDTSKHFRLPWDNYQHLVFVPENTPCDTLCKNHAGISPELCAEVKLQEMCPL